MRAILCGILAGFGAYMLTRTFGKPEFAVMSGAAYGLAVLVFLWAINAIPEKRVGKDPSDTAIIFYVLAFAMSAFALLAAVISTFMWFVRPGRAEISMMWVSVGFSCVSGYFYFIVHSMTKKPRRSPSPKRA